MFEARARTVGLSLNHSKCEIIGLNSHSRSTWTASGLQFQECENDSAILLGSPLFADGMDRVLQSKSDELTLTTSRLRHLSSHEAFCLLRGSLGLPRWLHLFRSSPCFRSPLLSKLNSTLRDSVSALFNVDLPDCAWSQCTLPVRWGGMGIRDVVDLAPSAYLSSCFSVNSMVESLVQEVSKAAFRSSIDTAISHWQAFGDVTLPDTSLRGFQKAWDDSICSLRVGGLLSSADPVARARILASGAVDSGSWIHAVPISNLGLHLSDGEFRIALGLRLGVSVVAEHICRCGVTVDSLGHHGLSCKLSAGRMTRHKAVNDIIARALRGAEIPVLLEPPGLLRDDGKRPDGMSLVPCKKCLPLLWDFTCPDTMAASHLRNSSILAGSVASGAEDRKVTKYSALTHNYTFVPIAVETFGSWGQSASLFVSDIGRHLQRTSGDSRSTSFLRQRISLAIQRGNAQSVMGTFHESCVALDQYFCP
jgi:hypothetical protein